MALFPVDELEALLIAAARERQTLSYGEVFGHFGLPFQRFQVGQLCAALDEVDRLQRGAGRAELAVLVVRQSDGLPGQGWWLSKNGPATPPGEPPWQGAFTGPAAAAHVQRHQARAFAWWAG